ncbi:hypothetical protein LR48_Vigan45s001200 [Vigna angularis]|uniref:Uncharacterized protein n=1 Tax=Phaseolus angularis TaxID=3914 RepID=A0A0L9T342_PHAAN|nr:hypothetical protein LR48_Vigan45s001200 [Vigna angularis]
MCDGRRRWTQRRQRGRNDEDTAAARTRHRERNGDEDAAAARTRRRERNGDDDATHLSSSLFSASSPPRDIPPAMCDGRRRWTQRRQRGRNDEDTAAARTRHRERNGDEDAAAARTRRRERNGDDDATVTEEGDGGQIWAHGRAEGRSARMEGRRADLWRWTEDSRKEATTKVTFRGSNPNSFTSSTRVLRLEQRTKDREESKCRMPTCATPASTLVGKMQFSRLR